jgi:plastocyanin
MSFALAALALPAVLFAACGGDDDDDTDGNTNGDSTQQAGSPEPGGDQPEIDQDDLSFKPDELTVSVGEVVLFKNSETALHTVTIDGENISGNMREGDTVEWTAEEAGEFEVTCDYHPQMHATITVE